MNLVTFVATHKTVSSAFGGVIAGVMAAEVAAPVVVASTDFAGIAALVMAGAALLAAVGVMVVNIINARAARAAQEVKDKIAEEQRKEDRAELAAATVAAREAKAMGEQVKLAVDGQTSKLVAAVERSASAEGKLEEKEKQAAVPESPKIAAAQAIIDKNELKEAVAAALKEALSAIPQFAPAPPAPAPGASPNITIEKVVADNVDAKTVNTDTLNTGKPKA